MQESQKPIRFFTGQAQDTLRSHFFQYHTRVPSPPKNCPICEYLGPPIKVISDKEYELWYFVDLLHDTLPTHIMKDLGPVLDLKALEEIDCLWRNI